jgi:4a-hydroxytetrahydrobiopterin dehydratase
MSDLAMLQCVACKGGTPPLRGPELEDLLARLRNDWRVVEEHHLEKEFRFKNFREALDFTNRVGDLAEEQGQTLRPGKATCSEPASGSCGSRRG